MARFAPFEPAPRLAVAVSGGPDSTALALLARDWVRARSGEILGLVVDHGLRPASAAEAARVRARLGAVGIPCEVLRWEGTKPTTRIEERAREERYRLLRRACREHRILHLLTGHHLDDQLETVAMRRERGSGALGLAGMPAERFFGEVRLLRPLLDIPRARLEATVRAAGLAVERDDLNLDLRFARARLRRRDLDRRSLLALAREAAVRRRRLEEELCRLAVDAVELRTLGWALLCRDPFDRAPGELAALLLARLVTTIGGREHPPRRQRLATALARLRAGGPQALTLGGCVLRRRAGSWSVCREPAAVASAGPFRPPCCVGFDHRFRVAVEGPAPFEIVSVREALRLGIRCPRVEEPCDGTPLPAAARLSLPVILSDGEPIALPPAYRATRGWRTGVSFEPRRRFLEAPFR